MNDIQKIAKLIELVKLFPDVTLAETAVLLEFANGGVVGNWVRKHFGMTFVEFKSKLLE